MRDFFKMTNVYASFEHSLVEELGYDGYERLRRGFDRAFEGVRNVPIFPTVVDAGCGTGLVGEQVSAVPSVCSCGQWNLNNGISCPSSET